MPEQHFSTFSEGLTAHRPKDMKELMACISLMQPMLDAIPNAVIFVKDAQARYLMANRTLVERCGLKSLAPCSDAPARKSFPRSSGRAIPSRTVASWKAAWYCRINWRCTCTAARSRAGA